MSYQQPPPPVKSLPANTWNASRLGWLLLAWFDGFGSRTLHKLRQRFEQNGEQAFLVDQATLRQCRCREDIIARFCAYREVTRAEDLAKRLEEQRIAFVLFEDTGYPALLRQIADPPRALFMRGAQIRENVEGIAIVGTRSHTPYGKHVARWLGRELALSGFAIVSGMAGGIDTIAHEAALEVHGYSVAVLGSSVDENSMYPKINLGLARRFVEAGCTMLSEYAPGTPAMPFSFPLRNRIISGICRATIVVEAAEHSGSLITAYQALEQNRDVFAVPGPITNAQSQGTNQLLAKGAIPCTGPESVIQQLRHNVESRPIHTQEVSSDERAILLTLASPQHVDDIARALRRPIAVICGQLVSLEMKGLIVAQGAQIYARSRYWNPSSD